MRYVVLVMIGLAAVVGLRAANQSAPVPDVSIVRLPESAIQPRIVADAFGGAHVVYYQGDPAAGDLFYRRLSSTGVWSSALRVNSHPGSAIAVGNIRGASLAVGAGDRVHVVWNGSSRATPRAPDSSTPMLYARLNDKGTAFEPERNLIHTAVGLDGGGAVAAFSAGDVAVAWHAGGSNSKGEGDRRVWLTRSTDGGVTFTTEVAVSPAETGACGCCGMGAMFDGGPLVLAYRGARDVFNRDAYLLVERGGTRFGFAATSIEPWNIGACPMSSFSMAYRLQGSLIAWETAGAVSFATIDRRTGARGPVVTPPGAAGQRKHPAIATNAKGDVLLAWTDGVAWQKGGALEWRFFDANGRSTSAGGRQVGVPMWSLVAAYARPDGGFVIVY